MASLIKNSLKLVPMVELVRYPRDISRGLSVKKTDLDAQTDSSFLFFFFFFFVSFSAWRKLVGQRTSPNVWYFYEFLNFSRENCTALRCRKLAALFGLNLIKWIPRHIIKIQASGPCRCVLLQTRIYACVSWSALGLPLVYNYMLCAGFVKFSGC